ncbi:hypothetical protein L2E82_09142 [Cichorium intybus]|uniref:Uncharacterized protein n=1 Tax=Cichorium intybus TaxID=13427 RepID=A0ACB9G721_CICIN|nr:hypothetical protein L2E82_09142 [Cichorium intybus]
MEKPTHTSSFFVVIIAILFLSQVVPSKGDGRWHVDKLTCSQQPVKNQTEFVSNFVSSMAQIGTVVGTSLNGTAHTGTGPDNTYILAQCYGDLTSEDCILCYAEARIVLSTCFPSNGARIYLDGCFMRNHNYNFFHEYTSPNDSVLCGNTTSKSGLFAVSVTQAVGNAVTEASRNWDYFARESMVNANESVFVMAQCWRSLSPADCRACLENASAALSRCLPWLEGRALNTGCFMRYSDTDFLNPIPVRSSSSNRGSYDAKKLIKMLNNSSLYFKYSSAEKATTNWDESNKLGQGGFGTVYKGVLSDGREIAVKRLFFNNKFRAADFYNEVNMISSVEHKNLVRLLGCSCSGPESILVYEYLPNMSLDRFIFEGLVYLHENTKNRIIHRDIKAANILLDIRLRAKIADFGLARSFQGDQSHISTAIAGTLGYMAPEYLAHGQLTEKADVYSFGVLLLEIVTGMENNRSKTTEYTDSLLSIAWKHFQENTVEKIFDPNLFMHLYPNTNYQKEAKKVVRVGLLCTQEASSLRPCMSAILRMLAKDEHLPVPSKPPFIDEKTMEFNDITEKLRYYNNRDDSSSIATVSHSHFFPR